MSTALNASSILSSARRGFILASSDAG
jgi:hypothetical protein